MMKPVRLILLAVLFAVCGSISAPASAQSSSQKGFNQLPASQRKLIAVQITGSKRYSQDAIVSTTGLQLGSTVTEDDFKKAARRLGDTGAFTDIGYTYSYSFDGTKLQLQLTDGGKFVPVRFEDFVWFSDADLRQRIKQYVPLFDGSVPTFGNLPNAVSDVLQAMLVEAGIPGHVDYIRVGKTDGPVEAIEYHVTEVLIRVRNINFTGAAPDETSALKQAARDLADREYSRSRLDLFAQKQLIPVFLARGFLKAKFGEPQPAFVNKPGPNDDLGPRNQSVVDVTFPVDPGRQYKVKTIGWSGNQEFPAETLEKMIRLAPGQPANTVRLSDELKNVQKLYGSHGYVTAAIKANADFDDAASTVDIRLDVNEGPVYHMGELQFRGLDNALTAKLHNAWKLRPGDVYDSTYLDQYLPDAQKLLPPNFDWEVQPHTTANIRDKTVDVDLIYSVKAPK